MKEVAKPTVSEMRWMASEMMAMEFEKMPATSSAAMNTKDIMMTMISLL
jgi:hypothetical protein